MADEQKLAAAIFPERAKYEGLQDVGLRAAEAMRQFVSRMATTLPPRHAQAGG
jgi:hypothetical protein